MKTCLKILFWFIIISNTVAVVSAAYYGEDWTLLVWIVAATLWFVNAEFSSRRVDRSYRELFEALKDSAKTHFDCFKLTIENFGLEMKNRSLEKADCKRQIRRKMHFARLRKSC